MKQSRSLPPVYVSLVLVLVLLAGLIVPILPTRVLAQEPGATEAPVSTEPVESLSPTDVPEQTTPDIVETQDPAINPTEDAAPATLPATEEPAPSVTEEPSFESVSTETEEPVVPFGLNEVGPLATGDPMSFQGLVVEPPEFACLTSDTVDVSLTILNADPTFQGVQIELFGSTLGTEAEVLQDTVLIGAAEGDGFFSRTLNGNFSDTFDRWFVSVRLLDGAGITHQLGVVQIELDCAPGPIKPGSPMSFTSFAIVPPTDCVNPGTVSASVLIHNADLTFQGLQVQLIGTTTSGETTVVQDTVLITPDQGSGSFNVTLTGDFGATFTSWRVFVRLLDGSGTTQQLTARSIDLDCAPDPIKGGPKATETVAPSETAVATETAIPGSPTSEPTGPVTFSNLQFDTVFDCSESTRMTGGVRLDTPTGPNEDVIVELFGFKPGISTPDLLDSTDIDSNQPAGVYDLVLFGNFTSTYTAWSVTVRSNPATVELVREITPDCDGTPPSATIEPTATATATEIPPTEPATVVSTSTAIPTETATEIPATEPATAVSTSIATATASVEASPTSPANDGVSFSDVQVDALTSCTSSEALTGTLVLNNPTSNASGIFITLFGVRADNDAREVLGSTSLSTFQDEGIHEWDLVGDFSDTYSSWFVVIDLRSLRNILLQSLTVEVVPVCDQASPTIVPTEVPTELPTIVPTLEPTEVPETPVIIDEPITIDFGIDIPEECGAGITLDGFITYSHIPGFEEQLARFVGFQQGESGVLVTLSGFDVLDVETVLETEFVAFTDTNGEAGFSLITDILPPFVRWSITFDLVLSDNEPERLGSAEFTISCPEPSESETATPAAAKPVYHGVASINPATGVVSNLPVTGSSPNSDVSTTPITAISLMASALLLFVLAVGLQRRRSD